MKFALYGGERVEAEANLKGAVCQVCKAEVIAKCGDIKIHHWAHKSKRKCDHWWENETQWHKDWKNQFSKDWQEIIHKSETGEKHIADIKTPKGLVVEFQHSPIDKDELSTRNTFYENIVWVVDGTRRKYDERNFEEEIEFSKELKRMDLGNSSLLIEWSGIQKPVFFDFGKPLLWAISDGWTFEFDKYDFIEGVKMGGDGKTLLHLLKEKVKNLYEERKSIEALERKRGRSLFGMGNRVTKRYKRKF